MNPNDLRGWVQNRVMERNGNITTNAVQLLVDMIGTDLWTIASEVEKLLLGAGANVDGRNPKGNIPLALAAEISYPPEIVPLLLDHGAEVNARDHNGVTPLMFAVHELGFPEIVKLLIEKGAQVDARSNSGSTPLHRVAQASTSGRYNYESMRFS